MKIMPITRWIAVLMMAIGFASTASATEPGDYRFPKEPGGDGWRIPVTTHRQGVDENANRGERQ
jgi:hypothetical protein